MTVLARDRADLVREHDPILQWRILDGRAKVIAQPSLARQPLRTFTDLADDAAERVALGSRAAALQYDLIDVLLWRFAFAHPRAFELGHARLLRPAPARVRREARRAADARDSP